MSVDGLSVFLAGVVYFLLRRIWYSSKLFGEKRSPFSLRKGVTFFLEWLACMFWSVAMEFFLIVFGSPSTIHGMYLGLLVWCFLIFPSALLQKDFSYQFVKEQTLQLIGLIYLGAFLGS